MKNHRESKMFAQKDYDEYVFLMSKADSIWLWEGESRQYLQAQQEAETAYQNYLYNSGQKREEEY
jgi:hypothetical protein